MLYVRVVKTKVGSRSVPVIRYANSKQVIVKYVDKVSADEEINSLSEIARSYIKDLSQQLSFFADEQLPDNVVMLSQCEWLGFY
jgi:hypothetical protein